MTLKLITKVAEGVFVVAVLFSHGAPAADPAVDKSQYTIFNPTPPSLMRDFEPDRPDLVDSAFTVDAGHIQLEADISNYTLSRPERNGSVTETFFFGPTEIRLGITNRAEVGVLMQPFKAVRTNFSDSDFDDWNIGSDVLEVSARFNLAGNDDFERPGAIAIGFKPFVEIPTVRNAVSDESIEGGLVIPFAVKLTDKLEAELMTEYDLLKNRLGSRYHIEYFNCVALTYQWNSIVSTYVEAASILGGDDPPDPVIILGAGVLFELSKNFSVDLASNFGVTDAADQVNLIIGLAKRF